jgi:hypothetical protein
MPIGIPILVIFAIIVIMLWVASKIGFEKVDVVQFLFYAGIVVAIFVTAIISFFNNDLAKKIFLFLSQIV